MFEEMGLTRKKGVTEELKFHRMNQNWQHLEKLINGIAETMNTFSDLIDKNYLSNITTSKAAHEETATFLLYIMEIGRKGRVSSLTTVSKIQADFLNPSRDKRLRIVSPKLADLTFQAHQITRQEFFFEASFFIPYKPKWILGKCCGIR